MDTSLENGFHIRLMKNCNQLEANPTSLLVRKILFSKK